MLSSFRKLFNNKNFKLLWGSQFFAQIAVQTLNFLVILKVFAETGSTIATSLVWLAFIAPAITIAPLASAFVDMLDKRKVMILANAAQALVILLYMVSHEQFVYAAYGIVLTYSLFNQFFIPAQVATLPAIVHRDQLAQANGLFLTTYQAALVIGFGISGLIVGSFGFTAGFAVALVMLGIATCLNWLLPEFPSKKLLKSELTKNIEIFTSSVIEGFNFIRSSKYIYLPFLTISILQMSLAVVVVNMPIFAERILGISAAYSGILMVVPAGVGAVVGIVIVSNLVAKGWRKKRIVRYSLVSLTTVIWLSIIILPVIPLPYRLILAVLFFAILGVSFIGIFISAQTYLQQVTPISMMGRVFGNSWFATTVATVFPMMFSATITEFLGPRVMFTMIALFLTSGLVYYNRKVFNL